MRIRPYDPTDEAAVVALWQACGLVVPWNDPHKDIRRKLAVNPEWFLIGDVEDDIMATCMAGYEGHRGWINYLAVHPDHRRRGHASSLMHEAERLLHDAGCPKINLQIRASNATVLAFYEALGYAAEEIVNLGKRLQDDSPST